MEQDIMSVKTCKNSLNSAIKKITDWIWGYRSYRQFGRNSYVCNAMQGSGWKRQAHYKLDWKNWKKLYQKYHFSQCVQLFFLSFIELSPGRILGVPVLLAKPQTYMNLSGESVRKLWNFEKIWSLLYMTCYLPQKKIVFFFF